MSRSLLIDPRSERSANAPLEIHRDPGRGPGLYVIEHSYPRPGVELRQIQRREGKRSSGAPVLGNRQIPLELFVMGRHHTPAAQPTNLITNPSVEIDTTGYVAVLSAVLSRVTTEQAYGETGLSVVTPGGAALEGTESPQVTSGIAGTQTIYGLCWVKAPAAARIRVTLREQTAANATVGDTDVDVVGTGDWQLVQVSRAFGGTGVRAKMLVRTGIAPAQAVTFYADAFLISTVDPAAAYFDGDTPGCSWTGTAGSSSSTQPAAPQTFFEAIAADAEAALWKLQLEGGTYSRPFEAGRLVFDVDTLAGGDDGALDGRRFSQQGTKLKATLDCLPYGRGATESGSVQNQTTDPVCVWTEAAVGGNVRALGEMEIVDTGSKDRRGLVAAIEQPDYDSTAATAALQLLAKDLTLLGTAALQARTGSHGGNTVKATLSPNWTAQLSTKIAASGLHLTHVGAFRIWGRVYAPSGLGGEISTRLEWGQGDLLSRELLAVDIVEQRGGFYLIDFGTVRIEKAKIGTQRWEARWLAKSTVAGDTLELDDLRIVPLDFAAIKVAKPVTIGTPTTFSARDEFDQTAGNLDAPKAAAVGGNWGETTKTGANGFVVETAGRTAQRTITGDLGITAGCRAFVGSALGLSTVSVDLKFSAVPAVGGVVYYGVMARYVDANNFVALVAEILGGSTTGDLYAWKVVGGAFSVLTAVARAIPLTPGVFRTLVLYVDTNGYYEGRTFAQGAAPGTALLAGTDADLATGGVLASGKPGLFDAHDSVTAITRNYDNFAAWVPAPDAAIFSGRRLRWRHDGVLREDSAGTLWSPLGDYEGDPLLVPAAAREKRLLRCIAFPTRGDFGQRPDGVATAGSGESDDFTAQLTRIARHANVRK